MATKFRAFISTLSRFKTKRCCEFRLKWSSSTPAGIQAGIRRSLSPVLPDYNPALSVAVFKARWATPAPSNHRGVQKKKTGTNRSCSAARCNKSRTQGVTRNSARATLCSWSWTMVQAFLSLRATPHNTPCSGGASPPRAPIQSDPPLPQTHATTAAFSTVRVESLL